MCGESAGFVIKSDYGGACGLGFEKKVFFDGARAARSVFFDGARAVRSVFLTVRRRGAAQVGMRGRGAKCFLTVRGRGAAQVGMRGRGAKCIFDGARAGAEMVIKCEMGRIRF